MYSIAIDPSANPASTVATLTFAGFLSVDEVECYAREFRVLFHRHRLDRGFSLLIDVSAAAIQSREVVAAFEQHMAGNPKSDRIAIVTGGSGARMQVRRMLARPYARLFVGLDEARAWLAEPLTLAA